MKSNKVLYWLFVPVIALITVVIKVFPVMPAVMQDEYIYSSAARHLPFSEHPFPNYLYSLVYQSTSLCDANFYSCAKSINVIFFVAMLVFVFLIAAHFLNRGAAVAITTATILSPLHVYISYFMPEVMYFAFMMATIWLFLKASQHNSTKFWAIAGAALGLTALVKPHALFAVPAFLLFSLLSTLKSEDRKRFDFLLAPVILLSTFIAVKFAIGFALAGPSGITLFGSGYGISESVFSSSESVSDQTQAALGSKSPLEVLISVSGLQLLLHSSFLLMLWGIPTLLSISVIFNAIRKKRNVTDLGAFVMLVGALTVTFAFVVAVFEGYASALGDDHSARIITRYYDFLFPLLLILGATVYRYVEPKGAFRTIQLLVLLVAGVWIGFYFPNNIHSGFSDSVTLVGFMNGWTQLVAEVLILGAVLIWAFKPDFGTKLLGWVVTPLVAVILGLSAQSNLMVKVGTSPAYFDIAGQEVKPYLDGIDGARIGVIGQKRTEVFTAKFWIDKPNIQDRLIGDDQELSVYMLQDLDYALILGTSDVVGAGEILTKGDNYALVKVDESLFMDK